MKTKNTSNSSGIAEIERGVSKSESIEPLEADKWTVQTFGERNSSNWEISVVRTDNKHGQRSWGWFGDDKLLVSHNGGPCHWPICGFVWDCQIVIAQELCRRLNAGESIECL